MEGSSLRKRLPKIERKESYTPVALHSYNDIMMYFLSLVFVFKLSNEKKCRLKNRKYVYKWRAIFCSFQTVHIMRLARVDV